jgi:hypothetical protein
MALIKHIIERRIMISIDSIFIGVSVDNIKLLLMFPFESTTFESSGFELELNQFPIVLFLNDIREY